MRMLLIGAGKTGSYLAENLWGRHDVVVVEQRGDRFRRMQSMIPDLKVVLGDACDPSVLEQAEVGRAEVVMAVTGHDEDNLVASWLSKRMGADTVLARVNHPRNEWLFDEDWGVDIPFSVSTLALRLVERETGAAAVVTLTRLLAEGATIEQIVLPAACGAVGKRLGDVHLPECAQVLAAVAPNGEMETAAPEMELRAGETLIVFFRCENRDEMLQALGIPASGTPLEETQVCESESEVEAGPPSTG